MDAADPFVPTHRHYKGGLYRLISNKVRLEIDCQRMCLYESAKGELWVRPYEDFMGRVTIETSAGTQVVLRFRQIGEIK